MTRHFITLILTFTLLSCEHHDKDNLPVIKQIADAVDASTVEVSYGSTANFSDENVLFELIIKDSKVLTDNGTNEYGIAGLASLIAFTKFHPSTIQDKTGIKVSFLPKQYSKELLFTFDELNDAKLFTANITRYLHLLDINDTISANKFVSNSHYDFSISQFHRAIKYRLKTGIAKITHMYEIREFKDKSTKSYKAYSVLTIIDFVDNSFVKIDFAVPIDKPDKLITVHFRD